MRITPRVISILKTVRRYDHAGGATNKDIYYGADGVLNLPTGTLNRMKNKLIYRTGGEEDARWCNTPHGRLRIVEPVTWHMLPEGKEVLESTEKGS